MLRDFVRDPAVAIDLSQCDRIDEVGLEVLCAAIREIREAGGDAWVSDAHEAVIRAAATADLGDALFVGAAAAS